MNYDAIIKAMQDELDNPRVCYLPGTPAEAVRDRLFKEMLWEEAGYFWSGHCSGGFSIQTLDVLNVRLKERAAKEHMPDWGTYGT
jgi:hypothetical protein